MQILSIYYNKCENNMNEIKRIQHYHSVTSGATPSADYLLLGELAINASKGDEQLFIKNNADEIVSFRDYKTIEKIIIDNEEITATALSELDKKTDALNEKIDNMSGNVSVKTIFGNDLKGEGNVNILSCGTF